MHPPVSLRLPFCTRPWPVVGVVVLILLVPVGVGCSGSRDVDVPGRGSGEGRNGPPPEEASPPAPSVASPSGPLASPAQPPSADEYAGIGRQRPTVAREIFAQTNRVREARGRSPLSLDSTLSRIACWHNQDMLVHDYMAHEDADRRHPSDRLAREHRRLIGTVGENVFEGTAPGRRSGQAWATSAMKQWLKSPGHRRNILRRSFTHLGVCATEHNSVLKATQVFTGVWAYFEDPLPWRLPAGDSLSVALRPVKAEGPPSRYAFVPVGEPLDQAFSGGTRGRSFTGTVHLPETPGAYGTRFLFSTDHGRNTVLSGPRVSVQ